MKRIDRIFVALDHSNNNNCEEINAVKDLPTVPPIMLAPRNDNAPSTIVACSDNDNAPAMMVVACNDNDNAPVMMVVTCNDNDNAPAMVAMTYNDNNNAPAMMAMTYNNNAPALMAVTCNDNDNAPAMMAMTYNNNSPALMAVTCNDNDNAPAMMGMTYNDNTPAMVDVTCTEHDSKSCEKKWNDTNVNHQFENHCDVESPVAPPYSPLTPLLARKTIPENDIDFQNREDSSPVRLMSPNTMELFMTLKGVLNEDIESENIVIEETGNREINQISGVQQINDTDSDSDYIPNSEEESDENILNRGRLRQIEVAALVHTSEQQQTNEYAIEDHIVVPNIDTYPPDNATNETTDCDSNHETNDHQDIFEAPKSRPKKGRKRKHEDHTLKEAKMRKYSNLTYHGSKKRVQPKVFHEYSCNCLKQCALLLPKEKRKEEFEKYVTLGSYEAQLLYIVTCVQETSKARSYTVVQGNRTGKKRPRNYTRKYKICDIEVCRDMFINNFQITTQKVNTALKKKRSGNAIKDQRGQTRGAWNKIAQEDFDFIKNVINSLPKYESHYRREQNSDCQYLKLGMTIRKIYDLYVEKLKEIHGEEKTPVSLTALQRIFYTNFNLRCKTLKKDTCSKCDTFTTKIQNTRTEEERNKLKEDKQNHLKRAEDLRNKMKEDLVRAKTDEHFECLTFDLEKTLPLPRIPTSIVFYKRQLWLYNCGIHAGSNDCGHCYVWIEGEAGRGAQEVGSCMVNFIKNKLDPNVKHLVLWSDCCGGQNRNIKIVLMLKVVLNSHPTLRTITLKYLESGHTFLPNDTDFSKIETQLKFHERIYTADEYINVIKSCKKKTPLQVYRMEKKDFLSTKNLEKKIVNRKSFVNKTKTNWLQTKEILLEKEAVHSIFMKTTLNTDHFQELNIEKKLKGSSLVISENDFSPLWPNGKEIPQAKLDDLKSMFDLIPKDCLGFYKSLKGNASLTDDIDGYDGPPDFIVETQEDDVNDTETLQ